MSFAGDVAAWTHTVPQLAQQTFERSVDGLFISVVDGSPITGSPGQPVGETGELRDSWRKEIRADEAQIFTDHPGAPTIEAGLREGRRLTFHRGGPHSLKLTIASWPAIVAEAVQQVAHG